MKDEVFREAETARSNYCASVISTAVGLKAKAKSDPTRGKKDFSLTPAVAAPTKKQTSEIGVGTEDLQVPKEGEQEAAQRDASANAMDAPPEKPPQGQEPMLDEEEGSDIVSVAVGFFGSLIFWVLKTVLISLPFAVVTGALSLFLFFGALSLISMQIAQDSGASMMGAGIETMFNRPGIV